MVFMVDIVVACGTTAVADVTSVSSSALYGALINMWRVNHKDSCNRPGKLVCTWSCSSALGR